MIRPRPLGVALLCLAAHLQAPAPAADGPRDPASFAGAWVPEAARVNYRDELSRVWRSKVTIEADRFVLPGFCGIMKDVAGTFTLDPAASPKRIDLTLPEIDLSERWAGVKYPACTLPGIYRIDGDRLTVCFQFGSNAHRPKDFEPRRDTAVLTVVRPREGFTHFPKEVTVRVVDPEGRPAAGAVVFTSMSRMVNPKKPEQSPAWRYEEVGKTGGCGTARVSYDGLAGALTAARDPARGLAGFAALSPASLQEAAATVTLAPECRVAGTVVSGQLAGAGKSVGWTNVMLGYEGRHVASCSSFSGEFEFRVPPGEYVLEAYGEDLPRKKVPLTVPAGRAELRVPPIELSASPLVALRGKPAPELEGVAGWKGTPTTLAGLRGRVVLLDFWGYWCGPCVAQMPVLMELHEKYAGKGLAIVGVHLDVDGEVGTTAQLDERLARIRRDLWNGKDVPFPVALIRRSEVKAPGGEIYYSASAARYGVEGYPTTIVIDREGNVVGRFHAGTDADKAAAEVEKLLGAGGAGD